MPIPNLLALNAFGSLPLQMHELQGGITPAQIGSDFGGTNRVFTEVTSHRGNHGNFAKTFKGERYCLTLSTTLAEVRRENEGGAGVWGVVFTHSLTATFTNPEYFLHIVKDGNDIALVMGFCRSGAPSICSAKSNTGQSGSWTEVNFSPGFGRMTSSSVVFRNRIYWYEATGSMLHELDPVAATHSGISNIGIFTNANMPDFCVAFDKLWLVAQDVAGALGRLALYEFTGGGWTFNSYIGATTGHNDTQQSCKWCLWTDNTNLYAVGYTEKDEANVDGQVGSTVWRGVPAGSSFTWTQNDTTMIAGLRPNARGFVLAARDDLWSIFVDSDTDPANPVFYLIVTQGPAPGTGHAIYQWNGFGVEMGPGPGASVSIAFTLPEQKQGGGESISQGAATYGEIEAETAIAGAYRLSYRTPGVVSGLTGRVYFSVGQGPPDTLATLAGGGTTFGPITGDNRSTLRTIDVSLTLSGISSGDASNWAIDLR